MEITLTKALFMQQVREIGGWFRQEHIIDHVSTSWDQMTGGAEEATLYMHRENETYGCYEASTGRDGMGFVWLPVNKKLVNYDCDK